MNYISKIKKEPLRIKNLSLAKTYNNLIIKTTKKFHFTTSAITFLISYGCIFEKMPVENLIIAGTITAFTGYNIILLKEKSELLDIILDKEDKIEDSFNSTNIL